ncbi:MAG: threonine synthase [Ruminococcaceae bacterium]|nr:threonine synthase [Oscillospiraceae bacterium]
MLYYSTRDASSSPRMVTAAEAIKEGLAPDGGLYLPETIPALTEADFDALLSMDYPERAAFLLSKYLTDYDPALLLEDCRAAYAPEKFPEPDDPADFGQRPAPLHPLADGITALELWHGPTSAFKDMALQIMPRLLSRALVMTGERRTAQILVATSGDTGKAALEGYRDVEGVAITVFYPTGGVSPMQARQMQTTRGSNVNVVAVRGNFDDAQNGVKRIFADRELAEEADLCGFFFSSANSINWGRLAPQIAYYVSAYLDLVNAGRIRMGDEVNAAVPTGNFGNIFAAYLAREMGVPVKRLICASNRNDVLTDFIQTGVYNREREFYKTVSPSMDILISSNLERLLRVLGGSALTRDLMASLAKTGKYEAPEELMEKIRSAFSGYSLDEAGTLSVIGETWKDEGYLIDPHTAVGLGAVRKYREETGDPLPVILASTASPFKFAAPVSAAIGLEEAEGGLYDGLRRLSSATGRPIPAPLAETETLPLRFERVIDPAGMAGVPFEH